VPSRTNDLDLTRRERRVRRALTLPPINRANLPERVDRVTAAAILTALFGPTSPRTLERWPLTWIRFNRRATTATPALLAEAERRFGEAPAMRGGKAAAMSTIKE
jgi:hypothetical protein